MFLDIFFESEQIQFDVIFRLESKQIHIINRKSDFLPSQKKRYSGQ